MTSNKFDTYPKNKDFYLKLIILGKKCLLVCQEIGIKPVIHGSVAYLFYTKDQNIEIRDLDVLIPELAMNNLTKAFTRKKIEFQSTDHPTIKVTDKDAIVSFHSMEYFTNGLPQSSTPVVIEGFKFEMLNLEALTKGYEKSLELEPSKYDKYSTKLENLKKISK